MDKKEASKLRMQKYRERNKSVTKSEESVTYSPESVTQYPPILYVLADPIKRKKLQSICDSLGKRNLQGEVFYGIGAHSIGFGIIEELLGVTSG